MERDWRLVDQGQGGRVDSGLKSIQACSLCEREAGKVYFLLGDCTGFPVEGKKREGVFVLDQRGGSYPCDIISTQKLSMRGRGKGRTQEALEKSQQRRKGGLHWGGSRRAP